MKRTHKTFTELIDNYAREQGVPPSDLKKVELIFQNPPIEKLEVNAIKSLTNCEELRLSTNAITQMVQLQGLKKLKLLSLSRNQIKHIRGLDDVGETLEQLWMSYNYLTKLEGLSKCTKLKILYVGVNNIANWEELDRIKDLENLHSVVFKGNPIYDKFEKEQDQRFEVLIKLLHLKMIDGVPVDLKDVERAEIEIKAREEAENED